MNLPRTACLVAWLACAGCGNSPPPAYPTQGKVQFTNGNPVKMGMVELKSRDHKVQARGPIQPDGSFVLSTYRQGDGAIAGVHDCVVIQLYIGEDVAGKAHGTYGVVNPRYGSYQTSNLTCTIEKGRDNNIELTVEGIGKLKEGGSEKDHRQ